MKAAEFHQARKFADTTFGRIAYVEKGSGPAALFIHGFPVNGFAWRERDRRSGAGAAMYRARSHGPRLHRDQGGPGSRLRPTGRDDCRISGSAGTVAGRSGRQRQRRKYHPGFRRALSGAAAQPHAHQIAKFTTCGRMRCSKRRSTSLLTRRSLIGIKTMVDAPALGAPGVRVGLRRCGANPRRGVPDLFRAAGLVGGAGANSMRRFLSLGNLKVLTSNRAAIARAQGADADRMGRGRHRVRPEIAGVAQEQHRQRAAPDHGAACEAVLPRGASQTDERPAAGILAQHSSEK